jgi:hypothetical protein
MPMGLSAAVPPATRGRSSDDQNRELYPFALDQRLGDKPVVRECNIDKFAEDLSDRFATIVSQLEQSVGPICGQQEADFNEVVERNA